MLKILSLAVAISCTTAQAAWVVGLKRDSSRADAPAMLLHQTWIDQTVVAPQSLGSRPYLLAEDLPPSTEQYEEILVNDLSDLPAAPAPIRDVDVAAEFRAIVEQGPPANRICLTILGDGYTAAEKEKFFADARRTADGLFTGDTFASYLPLFNIYAVFVPSQDSGISDVAKKKTAFGLYRSPPGSKRAIMPGNTLAMESALRAAPKTDYPIVLANDDFYGGLGGRYAISTRSERSGLIVLRHELGHNFGNVGEEYDGGQVYSGANTTRNPASPAWAHWVEAQPSVHEMKYLDGAYLWQNLAQGPATASFNFPANAATGPYSFDAIISFVGWATPGEVEVLIDGGPVKLDGAPTVDRGFYKLTLDRTLAPGAHRFEARELVHDGDNVLAFAELFAYEPGYDFSGRVGAYATFDEGGSRSYRPTHENCLMRDMLNRHFCAVDQENMWNRFLARVSLVDGVDVADRQVKLRAPLLPGLEIRWYKGAQELEAYRGLREFTAPADLSGALKVKATFQTPEVRKPAGGFSAEKAFNL